MSVLLGESQLRRREPSGTADEAWEATGSPWLFERFGEAWCAI